MTDASRFKQIEQLFRDASTLPAADRAAFIRGRAADETMAREILDLLERDARDEGSAIETPPLTDLHDLARQEQPLPDQLGPFQITGLLGRGGMGVVYRALQPSPRREVALKVMRPGSFGPATLRRFEQEAAILSRLDHPGIVPVFEAGTIEDAGGTTPYLAMSLVQGSRITAYVDETNARTDDRLLLIAKVCDAVQQAHERAIIHRDLKPSNILVDDQGQPRILDFGIARLDDAPDITAQTSAGSILGTLPYMSPEQFEAGAVPLDTRSDVYALGVLCYRLLAGKLPLELETSSIAQAALAVRETEPPKLSTVAPSMRGDIETLVATAMHKDRDRRYPSAAAFAEDIRRYLSRRPIAARPQTAGYLARRFAQRNTGLVVAASVAVLAAAGGVVGITFALLQAQAAERTANIEAARADEINRFLIEDLLGAAAPERNAVSDRVTVEELLDRSLAALDERTFEYPEVQAEIQRVIADTYLALGNYELAVDQWRRAADLSEPGSPPHVAALGTLASSLRFAGRAKEAEEILREADALAQSLPDSEAEIATTVTNNLAEALIAQGLFEEGAELHRGNLERRERAFGSDHPLVLETLNNLGAACFLMDDKQSAAAHFERCYEGRARVLGEDDPLTVLTLGNYALTLRRLGEYERASTMYRRVYEADRRILGEDHPETLTDLHNLAVISVSLEDFVEAERLFTEAIERRREILGTQHPAVAFSLVGLADIRIREDNQAAAAELLLQAVEIRAIHEDPDSRRLVSTVGRCAEALAASGRLSSARELIETHRARATEDETREAYDRILTELSGTN